MFDWFFTVETLRVLLTTILGSAAAIISAVIASRNVSKTIRNQNKGLPPELLRLEKIQEIIINHISDDFLKNIDTTGLVNEYRKALHRSILESQISNLGIQNEVAQKRLLRIPENNASNSLFPNLNYIYGTRSDRFASYTGVGFLMFAFLPMALFVLQVVAIPLSILLGSPEAKISDLEGYFTSGELITSSSIFLSFSIFLIMLGLSLVGRRSLPDIEADLIVRNIYQHHSEYFIGKKLLIKENEIELKKRVKFENSKKFREWLSLNPGKSSWDYGFNVDSPLGKEFTEGAIPSGFTVISGEFVFIRDFPFFNPNGRKVVKCKKGVKCERNTQQEEETLFKE